MGKSLRLARIISRLLDESINVFGFKFGLDPLLGLIPGLGDFVSFLLGIYILSVGIKMNLPKDKIALMISNLLFDFFIGLVPVLGDLGDFFFKSHVRNLRIIEEYLDRFSDKVIEGEIIN